MGEAMRGVSRRSFVAAGALAVIGLALRPARGIAEAVDPRSPVGLWGVARTDAGLLGLWSSGAGPAVVALSEAGPVVVERVVATPPPGVGVALVAGGAPATLGALDDGAAPAVVPISTDHLPESVRTALAGEVDGPVAVAGLARPVPPRRPMALDLDGAPVAIELPAVAGGIASTALVGGGLRWSAVQHPPTPEGDHCSALTVARDGLVVLEVTDLGSAGAATLVGPADAPIVSVPAGDGRLRAWMLGPEPAELVAPGPADRVALHAAGDRPIALLASAHGATLLRHGSSGWEAWRDVDGTSGCRRVLAVAGTEPAFLVEVADGVRLVDGDGVVR